MEKIENPNEQSKRELLTKLLLEKSKKGETTSLLSYGQQALWFIDLMEPNSSIYHVPFTYQMIFINAPLLETVLQRLIQHHPALQSRFPDDQGEPIQFFDRNSPPALTIMDAKSWTSTKIQDTLQHEFMRPFDLRKGPLFRTTVLLTHENRCILLFTLHHIITDGWSMRILLNDFRRLCYEEMLNQGLLSKSMLPENLPKISQTTNASHYKSFVYWQRQFVNSPAGEKQWHYWHAKLQDAEPLLTFQTKKPVMTESPFQAETHSFTLPLELSREIRVAAKQHNVTLYAFLLTAYSIVLYRYTQQENFIIGIPASGRSQAAFANLIGYFTNIVLLRIRIDKNQSVQELLQQVSLEIQNSIQNQDYPFSLLVKNLNFSRAFNKSSLYQTSFAVHPLSKDEKTKDFPFRIRQFETPLDLSFDIYFTEDLFQIEMTYKTALFTQTTIAHIAEQLQDILKEMMIKANEKVPFLQPITSNQKRCLTQWNETLTSLPPRPLIHTLFEEHAKKFPSYTACIFEDEHITYTILDQRANQLAHHLKNLGVESETLVGVALERSPDLLITIFAILKAGGAFVPLDPHMPIERLKYILRDTKLRYLVTHSMFKEFFSDYQEKIICLDCERMQIEAQSILPLSVQVTPHQLAYVIYTSGTTGYPKGVMIEHQSVVNYSLWFAEYTQLKPQQRLDFSANFMFDIAISMMVTPLLLGLSIAVCPDHIKYNMSSYIQFLLHYKINCIKLTPGYFKLLAQEIAADTLFPHLQTIILGGEKIPAIDCLTWLNRYPHHVLFNEYGPTEITVAATQHRLVMDELIHSEVPIGKPGSNMRCYVLNNQLIPPPLGVPGELYIGGLGVARGYLNQLQLTQEKFIQHPENPEERLYKTGDLVRFNEEGSLEFLDRMDRQVKLAGYRIELSEIETIIRQQCEVIDAVVVLESFEKEKHLIAYIVSPVTKNTAEYRSTLKAYLPTYMLPTSFIQIENIPLTTSGKIDFKALPAIQRPTAKESFMHARDSIEYQLCQIWQALLNVSHVGIYDDFFSLGGHSLLTVRFIAAIEKAFSHKLSITEFFANPTIADIAILLRQHGFKHKPKCLLPIQTAESMPLFLIHEISGWATVYLRLKNHLPKQSMYGISNPHFGRPDQRFHSLQEMAAFYITKIKEVQKTGPYYLAGWSFGGVIAFEMANQLEQMNENVAMVILIDSVLSQPSMDETLSSHTMENYLKQISTYFTPQEIQSIRIEIQNNIKLMIHYQPVRVYQGKTFLLQTSDHVLRKDEQQWNKHVQTPVEIYPVIGDHYQLLDEPYVQNIAKTINTILLKRNLE